MLSTRTALRLTVAVTDGLRTSLDRVDSACDHRPPIAPGNSSCRRMPSPWSKLTENRPVSRACVAPASASTPSYSRRDQQNNRGNIWVIRDRRRHLQRFSPEGQPCSALSAANLWACPVDFSECSIFATVIFGWASSREIALIIIGIWAVLAAMAAKSSRRARWQISRRYESARECGFSA